MNSLLNISVGLGIMAGLIAQIYKVVHAFISSNKLIILIPTLVLISAALILLFYTGIFKRTEKA